MMQDLWNAPTGFRPSKSAPCSPLKPIGISRTNSESFHVTHKVPVGDTPYVKAKHVQLVDKDPDRAIPLFWAAINAGDRVDSALKDMAIVMKQQNRAEEAIEAIKSLRNRCSDQAQESLDNILLDLYKRCGRLDDQITLLKHKLFLILQGMAFNGKRTKTARSQGKKFQVSVEQEATRLLGNLGWALMQQNNYIEAEEVYRQALSISQDNNKMCNLGICLMKQGRIAEAKETLRRVKPATIDGPRGVDSHLKAFERAQQMLRDLESEMMNKGVDRVEQSRLFDNLLGSSSIWQPQPCKEANVLSCSTANMTATIKQDTFADENVDSNRITTQRSLKPGVPSGNSLKIDAPPFYSSNLNKDPCENQLRDPLCRLKRTRSGHDAPSLVRGLERENYPGHAALTGTEQPEQKARRRSPLIEELLPDNMDFEEAIVAAILGSTDPKPKTEDTNIAGICQREKDKRLKVFQDITLSLSPRA